MIKKEPLKKLVDEHLDVLFFGSHSKEQYCYTVRAAIESIDSNSSLQRDVSKVFGYSWGEIKNNLLRNNIDLDQRYYPDPI